MLVIVSSVCQDGSIQQSYLMVLTMLMIIVIIIVEIAIIIGRTRTINKTIETFPYFSLFPSILTLSNDGILDFFGKKY